MFCWWDKYCHWTSELSNTPSWSHSNFEKSSGALLNIDSSENGTEVSESVIILLQSYILGYNLFVICFFKFKSSIHRSISRVKFPPSQSFHSIRHLPLCKSWISCFSHVVLGKGKFPIVPNQPHEEVGTWHPVDDGARGGRTSFSADGSPFIPETWGFSGEMIIKVSKQWADSKTVIMSFSVLRESHDLSGNNHAACSWEISGSAKFRQEEHLSDKIKAVALNKHAK